MSKFHDRINALYDAARDRDHRIGRKKFAELTNATEGQMNGWLSGVGEPDCDMLVKIAVAHNVSVSWLVGETNIKNHKELPLYEGLPTRAIEDLSAYVEFLHYRYLGKPPKLNVDES